MMGSWWFIWMIFMVMFLLPPIGYGWGYRGWGAPIPSYVQRRRHAAAVPTVPPRDHRAWGWGGDFVWAIVFVGVIWAMWGAFFWARP